MRFLRFVWKLFVMASVFGIGYIIGREHSFEEEEMWEEEAEKENKTEAGTGSGAMVEKEFTLENASATKVSIVGTFNDWNKDTHPLSLENGIWKARINLKPGKHEYQFVINDTDWIVDPKRDNSVENKYDGKNSIIEVG
jgi:1,4-alpha-glucan branching enzyme